MVHIYVIMSAVALLMAAFSALLICLCVDVIPIIKSRGSTLVSRDSVTKEQTKKLKQSLQRHNTELVTEKLDKTVNMDMKNNESDKNENCVEDVAITISDSSAITSHSAISIATISQHPDTTDTGRATSNEGRATSDEQLPITVSVHRNIATMPSSNITINSSSNDVIKQDYLAFPLEQLPNVTSTSVKLPMISSTYRCFSNPEYQTESKKISFNQHSAPSRPLVIRSTSLPAPHASLSGEPSEWKSLTDTERDVPLENAHHASSDLSEERREGKRRLFCRAEHVRNNGDGRRDVTSRCNCIKSSPTSSQKVVSVQTKKRCSRNHHGKVGVTRNSPIAASSLHGTGARTSASSSPLSSHPGGRSLKIKLEDIKEDVSCSEEDPLVTNKRDCYLSMKDNNAFRIVADAQLSDQTGLHACALPTSLRSLNIEDAAPS